METALPGLIQAGAAAAPAMIAASDRKLKKGVKSAKPKALNKMISAHLKGKY